MYWIKKVSFTLFVLVVSFAIYTLVDHKNTLQDPVLKNSLDLLGKQLFAKMADDQDREDAEKYYFNFVNDLEKNKVTEQEIEHFVTVALNYNARDTIHSSSALLQELRNIPAPPPKSQVWVSSSDTNTIDVNLEIDLPDWKENSTEFANRVHDLVMFQHTLNHVYSDSLIHLNGRPMAFSRRKDGKGVSVNMHPKVMRIIKRQSQELTKKKLEQQQNWLKEKKREQHEFEKMELEKIHQLAKLESLLVRLEQEKALMSDTLAVIIPHND